MGDRPGVPSADAWQHQRVRLGLAFALMLGLSLPASVSAQHDRAGRSERAAELRARGDAHAAAGDRGSAIAWYRDAISADPSDALSYERLGRVYLARGALGDARTVLEAGAQRRPDHVGLARALAETLERMSAPEDAARVLRQLARRAPRDPEVHVARAELAARRGAWSEALAAHRALIALHEDGVDLDAGAIEHARQSVIALRFLVGTADPVRRGCESGSSVRRALAGCGAP